MQFLDPAPSPRLAGRYERGYLPHRRSQGRTYFVTFRLTGTLPEEVLVQYQHEHESSLAKATATDDLPSKEEQCLSALQSDRIDAYLDAGRGDCWLREPRIAELVIGAIRFFHGQRYDLGAWVLMPNHVHLLVRPHGAFLLDRIVQSWKSFTARRANQLLGRSGASFWAREYYDHLVRDDDERHRLVNYIHDNPVKAGLCARWEDWPWSSAQPHWS